MRVSTTIQDKDEIDRLIFRLNGREGEFKPRAYPGRPGDQLNELLRIIKQNVRPLNAVKYVVPMDCKLVVSIAHKADLVFNPGSIVYVSSETKYWSQSDPKPKLWTDVWGTIDIVSMKYVKSDNSIEEIKI